MDTIERLASEIRRHRDLYYNAAPELTDPEYDALEERLRALAPDHPVLSEVGAPLSRRPRGRATARGSARSPDWLRNLSDRQYDGYTPNKVEEDDYRATYEALVKNEHPMVGLVLPPRGYDWPKARHEIPMGSLNKVNTGEELVEWAQRCDELARARGLDAMSDDIAMTEKLDGISLEVVYQDGRLEAAITRGDGVVGECITSNILHIASIPKNIRHRGMLSVRGEVVLGRSEAPAMKSLREEIDPNFDGELSLRNTAAGAARAKSTRFVQGVGLLSAYFYDVEGTEGLATETDKFDLLRTLGFATPSLVTGDVTTMVDHYRDYSDRRRDALDYEIDGLVVRAHQIRTFLLLGELNNRPRAAVAFKFGHEMAVTRLVDVLWETGDSGRITPVAVVEPVRLVGANVERASLHNLANVKALQIGVGDEVLISRRNDVIPYVEKVEVKGERYETAPTSCGRCQGPVAVEGEYLVCKNPECPARRIGRLKTWINAIGLLEWGEKTFELLYDRGMAREPADLYLLTPEQLTALAGFGAKRAQKLLEPLKAQKEIPLATFIAALGIESVSKETGKLLVEAGFDDVEALAQATVDDLAQIPGLGSIKAEKIKTGLLARLDEVHRLEGLGVVAIKPSEGGSLAGVSVCFSGSHQRPRKVLQALVENNGGSVRSGVTKGLTYLVLADPNSTSSKAEKARTLGTAVISEEQLLAIISAA